MPLGFSVAAQMFCFCKGQAGTEQQVTRGHLPSLRTSGGRMGKGEEFTNLVSAIQSLGGKSLALDIYVPSTWD